MTVPPEELTVSIDSEPSRRLPLRELRSSTRDCVNARFKSLSCVVLEVWGKMELIRPETREAILDLTELVSNVQEASLVWRLT